jgi:uncharacterized membrane protein YhaH (DUF805 family)
MNGRKSAQITRDTQLATQARIFFWGSLTWVIIAAALLSSEIIHHSDIFSNANAATPPSVYIAIIATATLVQCIGLAVRRLRSAPHGTTTAMKVHVALPAFLLALSTVYIGFYLLSHFKPL